MLALTNAGITMNRVLGNCVNKAEECRQNGGWDRFGSHTMGLFVVIPIEGSALVVNLARMVFEALATCFIKLALLISKKVNEKSNSTKTLQKWDAKINPLSTAGKVGKLALGLVVSVACAWSIPYINYAAHKLLGLVNDKVEPLPQKTKSKMKRPEKEERKKELQFKKPEGRPPAAQKPKAAEPVNETLEDEGEKVIRELDEGFQKMEATLDQMIPKKKSE